MTPIISFLVTCKDEGESLRTLLTRLLLYKDNAECIILSDFSDDVLTRTILDECVDPFFKKYTHGLNNNYSEHKNHGKSMCTGKYIFQIDADELPSTLLLDNLIELVQLNDVDLIWVPRVNDFRGVTPEHAAQWGWKLKPYENRFIVNFPDYQSRIFKNIPSLNWKNRLHEKIDGAKTVAALPQIYEYSLIHTKTIDKQIETNIRYNTQFTADENRGYKSK